MPQSADDLVQRLQDAMRSLEPMVDGGVFRGVGVRREGDRFCMVFRWCRKWIGTTASSFI
jgi:hypothetical protein